MPGSDAPLRVALLVDVHENTRTLVRKMLEHLGFVVRASATITEALALPESDRDRLSLIVAPLENPGLSGPDLHDVLARKGRRIPTVYVASVVHRGARGLRDHETLLPMPF